MDFKFLGIIALVLIVVSGGAVIPMLSGAVLIGLAGLAFEATTKLHDEYQERNPK